MQVGVLGTGMVGKALGTKLVTLGHDVMMGSRTRDNSTAEEWTLEQGNRAHHGTFSDAAAYGALLVNATAGIVSIEALRTIDPVHLVDKVLLDVANPLDFSHGFPPTLEIINTNSLGEEIQRTFPALRIVKALSTMSCDIMVEPQKVSGSHNVLMCGNDAEAKGVVRELLTAFGWSDSDVIDLGDITGARGMEMLLPVWLRLMGTLGTPHFNFKIVRS